MEIIKSIQTIGVNGCSCICGCSCNYCTLGWLNHESTSDSIGHTSSTNGMNTYGG